MGVKQSISYPLKYKDKVKRDEKEGMESPGIPFIHTTRDIMT